MCLCKMLPNDSEHGRGKVGYNVGVPAECHDWVQPRATPTAQQHSRSEAAGGAGMHREKAWLFLSYLITKALYEYGS